MGSMQPFSGVEQQRIRSELDRILASERFVNANRLSGLLRYVVEETLAGRRERIKAFSIAQDVYGRDASFNQQRDPIVRVDASRLRKCLAEYYDSAGKDSRLRIEIPKGGYGPTFSVQSPAPAALRRLSAATPMRFGVAALVLTAIFWFGWQAIPETNKQQRIGNSVFLAVLPLRISSSDNQAALLAEGFVDSTITQLARIPDLSVMAHASMMEFKHEDMNLRFLRDNYGVSHILRGSIDTRGDAVRIQSQLIDTRSAETIWSDNLVGEPSDLWLLQNALATKVLAALSETEARAGSSLPQRPTDSSEALALYRQGLFMILPPNEIKRVEAARQLFARVREIDPGFAGGYAGASWSYALPVLFNNTTAPAESLAQAVDFAEQAIEADPSFGAGYAVLGFAQALSGKRANALENARHGAAVQPGNAFVQFLKAVTLILAGRPEESFAPLEEAIRLNPAEVRAPYLNVNSIARYANAEYRASLQQLQQNATRSGPGGPHMEVFRAAAYAQLGEDGKAAIIVGELNESFPDYPYAAWLASWLGPGDHLDTTLEKLELLGLDVCWGSCLMR